MKKFGKLVIVLLLFIGASILIYMAIDKKKTTSKLEDMGYSIEDIVLIKKKLTSDDMKSLENLEFNKNFINFIIVDDFIFDNLVKYNEYKVSNEVNNYEDVVMLVNKNINLPYSSELMNIFNDKFYKEANLSRYLKYFESTKKDVVKEVNSNLDYEFYTNIKSTNMSQGNLILVNKYNGLDKDYEPDNLVQIEGYNNFYLKKEAYDAYVSLINDASKQGYIMRPVSPYRSYNTQNRLYENYASSDGYKEADRYSARPGHSEHQTGLAIDVSGSFGGMDDFGDTPEFKWMTENAAEYGFILRYTEDTEYITGYMNEPWHYRYVGVDHAIKIKDLGITFEEYYEFYIKDK